MKTCNAPPVKRHSFTKLYILLQLLFSVYRKMLPLEIILLCFYSYFMFAKESQDESTNLLQSARFGMLGTDSVDNLILTCWYYETELSDLETWFIRLFSYVPRNQAYIQKTMSCCKLSQEKVKYLDAWIRRSQASCLDGRQVSFTLPPFYTRIKRAMYLPKTSADNTFCPTKIYPVPFDRLSD